MVAGRTKKQMQRSPGGGCQQSRSMIPQRFLVLPPIDAEASNERRVMTVVDAPQMLEGAGFEVRRAFAGVDLRLLTPSFF